MKAAWLCALAACTKFAPEDVVVDMRVLAMQADVPEQVLDVDLANPPPVTDLLAQMVPTRMCALVADPMIMSVDQFNGMLKNEVTMNGQLVKAAKVEVN